MACRCRPLLLGVASLSQLRLGKLVTEESLKLPVQCLVGECALLNVSLQF
ncbi:hypothetical protein ACRRTK_010969 [Alexandromys fortis]